MEIGYLKFIRPSHPIISKWIKGYYVHTSDDPEFYSKVTFYQNITTTISIYKNSQTTSEGRSRQQYYRKGRGFTSLLAGLVDRYQEVEFHGPLDRLAIVFYPCGLNQFIREPLGNFLQKHYSHFHYFDQQFDRLLPIVFNESSLEKKRDYLDSFFLDQFKLLDEPILMDAVETLVDNEEPIKVKNLAELFAISRRTLLREFKKHLGYSIEDYISVIKFRKALLNFQLNHENVRLTDIALNSAYYDQADFNHQIKYRSELTPKELFKQLEIVDNTLFWKL